MQIRVLIFGPAAWEQGAGEVVVELAGDAPHTESQIREAMMRQHRPLEPFVVAGRFAVNNRFADGDCAIGPDDEVALIAMVSGG